MISFITSGRNDNHGASKPNTFLDRFYTATNINLDIINSFKVPYEYLIVEWSPIKEYLIYEKQFKDLFNNIDNKLRDIVVTPSVAINDGLNPIRFYEYFAKNVGIRQAKYDTVIILNADIVIPYYAMNHFINLITTGFDKKTYYRPLVRSQVDINLSEIEKYKIDCENEPRLKPCGSYPGDLFMMDRKTLIECSEGFDETNMMHRSYDLSQRGMDSEIMWNLYHHGCNLKYFPCNYLHIEHEHGKHEAFDSEIWEFNMDGYENRPDWGYVNYNTTFVNDKLIIIS